MNNMNRAARPCMAKLQQILHNGITPTTTRIAAQVARQQKSFVELPPVQMTAKRFFSMDVSLGSAAPLSSQSTVVPPFPSVPFSSAAVQPQLSNKNSGEDYRNSAVDQWANDIEQMIRPKYWTGTPAHDMSKVQVDCSLMNLGKYVTKHSDSHHEIDTEQPAVKEFVSRLREAFDDHGLAVAVNTGLEDAETIRTYMRLVIPNVMKYEAGANMRDYTYGENVYDTGAPRQAHLHYHHEMAYVNESTEWVGFMALEACYDNKKGASFIAHNVKATDELMANPLGQKLKEKGICYVRKLPDRKYFLENGLDESLVYNYWQTSMGTEDMAKAQKIAEKTGLEVEWEDSPIFGRYMVTKYYTSAFEYCPHTDSNLLYCSIADDYTWFDTWPGVEKLPHFERPLKMNFGDDTIMTREEKQILTDVYDNAGTPVFWNKGDFCLACNYRTAHGRPEYELLPGEQRELGVVLGSRFSRVGDLPEKW